MRNNKATKMLEMKRIAAEKKMVAEESFLVSEGTVPRKKPVVKVKTEVETRPPSDTGTLLSRTDAVPRMFKDEKALKEALITHARDLHIQGKTTKFYKHTSANAVKYICKVTSVVFMSFRPDFLKHVDQDPED